MASGLLSVFRSVPEPPSLNLGLAYETLARVAAIAGDPPTFEAAAQLCGEEFTRHRSRALAAKHQQLLHDHCASGVGPNVPATKPTGIKQQSLNPTKLGSMLGASADSRERLDRGLLLLVRAADADGAILSTRIGGKIEKRAEVGDVSPRPNVDELVSGFLDEASGDDVTHTCTAGPNGFDAFQDVEHGRYLHPLLLNHGVDGHLAITGCILLCARKSTLEIEPEVTASLSRALSEQGDLLSQFLDE
ncbi:MAG: hypothetical protein OXR73_09765 [Myxococcales bacterium]|nr:hypothetical protein [Myxococcales bacterium]